MTESNGKDINYPAAQVVNDVLTLRASAFGGCYRALVAEALGYVAEQVSKMIYEIFEEGHEREPVIVDRLSREYNIEPISNEILDKEYGVEISEGQPHVSWEVYSGIVISGHLDKIAIYKDKKYLVEVKTASPDSYAYFEKNKLEKPKIDKYPWQVSIYYYALKRLIPDLAGIIYAVQEKTDKGAEKDRIFVFTLDPPKTEQEITSRALIIRSYYMMLRDDENAPMPPCTNDWVCNYKYLHEEKERVRINDVEMHQYGMLNQKKKEIEKEMEELKEIIVERYKDDPRRGDGFEDSEFKFSLAKIDGKKFDKNAVGKILEGIGHNIDDFYIPGKPYYRLEAKVK